MAKIINEIKISKSMAVYPLISPKERLLVWERIKGMWKNRKPDPIKELKKMRREWERKFSSLTK